jgi:hypothetical protein
MTRPPHAGSLLAAAALLLALSLADPPRARPEPTIAAAPARLPLLVVPGHMGSVPPMKHAASFAFRRGAPPGALELAASYGPLLASLEQAGYRRDVDLFTAPWDWRMAVAPDDGSSDGRIDGLAAPLAQPDLAYAAGYLGHALARVAAARPEAREIDVVAHGLGGILVRAYLQSDAYGESLERAGGGAVALPRIRRFVQVGVPQRGQAVAWNPWHGNFADFGTGLEIARKVLPLAFQAVRTGNTIAGPDRPIDRKSILRRDEVDPTTFYRVYDAGARALLPTYAFLARAKGARAVSQGPGRNPLLLDLNASSAGAIAWQGRVERAVITHGAGLPTVVSMRRHQGPDPRDPAAGVILILPRLQGGEKIAPKPRQGWFEPIVDPRGGDGVVPLVSLAPDAKDDPRVVHRAWAPRSTAGAAETPTDGAVGHEELLSNPEVLKWLAGRLEPLPRSPGTPAR